MRTLRTSIAASLVAVAIALAAVSVATAQTTVVVRVRAADGGPADARVTLTPDGGGAAHSCQTQAGTCRMSLPAGTYVVSARPSGRGEPPIPRPVPVPPSTEVTISVTLR